MKIIITGGNGYIGRALARGALERGHEVVLAVRNPRALAPRPGASVIQLPLGDAGWQVALRGVDSVVALAGAPVARRWTSAWKQEILTSRLDHVRQLVGAIAARPADARPMSLVVASGSAGWLPPGASYLTDVCHAVEREAAEVSRANVRQVSVRIGPVLGPGAPAAPRWLPILGDGLQVLPWIWIDDLVQMLLKVTTDVMGGIVAGSAPASVEQRVAARVLAEARGLPRPWRLPGWALRAVLGEAAAEVALASHRIPEAESEHSYYLLGSRRWRAPTIERAAELLAQAERSSFLQGRAA